MNAVAGPAPSQDIGKCNRIGRRDQAYAGCTDTQQHEPATGFLARSDGIPERFADFDFGYVQFDQVFAGGFDDPRLPAGEPASAASRQPIAVEDACAALYCALVWQGNLQMQGAIFQPNGCACGLEFHRCQLKSILRGISEDVQPPDRICRQNATLQEFARTKKDRFAWHLPHERIGINARCRQTAPGKSSDQVVIHSQSRIGKAGCRRSLADERRRLAGTAG